MKKNLIVVWIVLFITIVILSTSIIGNIFPHYTSRLTTSTFNPTQGPCSGYKFNLPNTGYDFGGRTITVCSYHGGEFQQNEDFMRRLYLNGLMEELYNVKIQYTTDLASAESAALAGSPTADIAYISPGQLARWIKKGIAEPLNNYSAQLKLNDSRWDQTLLKWTNINSKQYAVGTKPQEKWKSNNVYAMFMNKDLLQTCSIDPDSIYKKQENNEWNWSEFSLTASRITRDLDGDDKPDVFGTSLNSNNFFESFMVSNETNIINENDKNDFTFCAGNKVIEVIDYLNMLIKKCYARGPESVSGVTTDQDLSDFCNGKIGFSVQNVQITDNPLSIKNAYGVLCIPMGPNTSDYYFTDSTYAVTAMFAQTDKARARELAQFIYIYNTSLYITDEDELECYWFDANIRICDEGSKYFFERVYERKNVILINNAMYIFNGLPFSIEPIYKGEKTAKQIIDEQTPACVNFMKAYFS